MNKINAIDKAHWDEVKRDQKKRMKTLREYYLELIEKGCMPCEKHFDCEILNCAKQCKDEGFIHGAISNLVGCKDLTVRMLGEHEVNREVNQEAKNAV